MASKRGCAAQPPTARGRSGGEGAQKTGNEYVDMQRCVVHVSGMVISSPAALRWQRVAAMKGATASDDRWADKRVRTFQKPAAPSGWGRWGRHASDRIERKDKTQESEEDCQVSRRPVSRETVGSHTMTGAQCAARGWASRNGAHSGTMTHVHYLTSVPVNAVIDSSRDKEEHSMLRQNRQLPPKGKT